MYKVLIIEDEPPILRGICTAISKCSVDFEVEDTAFNGDEAVNLLKQKHYDLIITDINMPVKDGFYVLEYLKDNNIDSIRIILSGYEEFSYAQKALNFNIKDYLVKPIDKEKLTALLKEVTQEIETKKYNHKQEIFNKFVHQKNLPNSNVAFDEDYVMMLICAGTIPPTGDDFMSPGSTFWEDNNLHECVKDNNLINEYWLVSGNSLAEKVLIVSCDLRDKKAIANDILDDLDKGDVPISIAVSEKIKDYDIIYCLHVSLRKMLERNMIFSISSIWYLADSEKSVLNEHFKLSEFKTALSLSNDKSVKTALDNIISNMHNRNLSLDQVKNVLNRIVLRLFESYTYEQNQVYALTLVEEMLLNSLNYDELKSTLYQLVDKMHNSASFYDDKAVLAKKIKQYIDENMNKPLTNKTLSQHFHLVPSYISSIFKSAFGISSAEYIVDIRIEKAKKLLLNNPDALTKDIAKAVGYNDPLYFSKVFKKKTGITPSKYLKE